MKVAVYDRWWSTAGGGEKFAGGLAEVLSVDHDVDLIVHEPVDLGFLGERLQLDLSRCGTREVPLGDPDVSDASADYDLFLNASFHSAAVNRATHGIYVVHFPVPPVDEPPGWKREAKKLLRPLVAAPGYQVRLERGFHPEERIGRELVQWTTGDAVAEVTVPAGERVDAVVRLGRFHAPELGALPVRIEVDGVERAAVRLAPRRSRSDRSVVPISVWIEGHDDGTPVQIRIVSESHIPAELLGTNDDRRLGVAVAGVQLGSGPKSVMRRRYPSLTGRPHGLDWLSSYDRVVANSAFTREWIKRWWHLDTAILHPPVTLQPALDKRPIILHVGRFFAAEHGHSKKQLELVRAFRALVSRGHLDGWELHLVGGCSLPDRPYLDKVVAEAGDLPLVIHVDASGAELRRLYGEASIYWHATGLGEDEEAAPDRFEHFGITTVEAMSAGAVPVVIAKAGQLEVVEHGVSGFHFDSLAQLERFTERLVDDTAKRTRMAEAARARAEHFGTEAFAAHLRELVADVCAPQPTPDPPTTGGDELP